MAPEILEIERIEKQSSQVTINNADESAALGSPSKPINPRCNAARINPERTNPEFHTATGRRIDAEVASRKAAGDGGSGADRCRTQTRDSRPRMRVVSRPEDRARVTHHEGSTGQPYIAPEGRGPRSRSGNGGSPALLGPLIG